jgi:hypothetical protein
MVDDLSNPPFLSTGVVVPMVGLMMTALRHLGVFHLDPDTTAQLIRQLIEHASLILGVVGRVTATRLIKA